MFQLGGDLGLAEEVSSAALPLAILADTFERDIAVQLLVLGHKYLAQPAPGMGSNYPIAQPRRWRWKRRGLRRPWRHGRNPWVTRHFPRRVGGGVHRLQVLDAPPDLGQQRRVLRKPVVGATHILGAPRSVRIPEQEYGGSDVHGLFGHGRSPPEGEGINWHRGRAGPWLAARAPPATSGGQ